MLVECVSSFNFKWPSIYCVHPSGMEKFREIDFGLFFQLDAFGYFYECEYIFFDIQQFNYVPNNNTNISTTYHWCVREANSLVRAISIFAAIIWLDGNLQSHALRSPQIRNNCKLKGFANIKVKVSGKYSIGSVIPINKLTPSVRSLS